MAANTRTVAAAIAELTRALAEAGVETPARDARLLVAAATGASTASLISRPERELTLEEIEKLNAFKAQRVGREPVSRILGARAFYGREFALSPATLDPRPDTETLIEEVLALADENGWRERPIRILDIGTGTGCLLLTLLTELPLSTGLGTDISPAALEIAGANAHHLGVEKRASFELRNGLEGVEGPFDLVVSNPPYIATAEIASLAPEVREFDPQGALDGGADGLDLYRQIIPGLRGVVRSGWVVFEVGAGQAESVAEMLRQSAAGHTPGQIRQRADLGGHIRSVATQIHL